MKERLLVMYLRVPNTLRIAVFVVCMMCFMPFVAQAQGGQGIIGIEPCVSENGTPQPDKIPGLEGCRDIEILLLQLIRIAEFLFSIIGSVAFVFFVYGGFNMILSMGNPERVKKGTQTLLAATVGLVIAFSAYILVGFVMEALGVAPAFRVL